MQNIYAPERQPGETQKQYRERLARTRKSVTGRPISLRELGKDPGRKDRMRAAAKARRGAPTQPKFPKERRHKQHAHPLRDEHGAYTVVGSVYEVEGMAPDTAREHVISSWVDGGDMGYTARRKWLAGVSARRGY